jgi:hypothetical protein
MIPISTDALCDPLVQRYAALFAPIDWAAIDGATRKQSLPGPVPHPPRAYIGALVVKIHESLPSIPRLRQFLIEHPGLVLALGFRPRPDPTQPLGFDVERTVPGERWLRHQQQWIDQALVERVLTQTVHVLRHHVPDLGVTVAIDTTHIYAYVRENNPKESIRHRFAKGRQPRGDRDCRLGVKARINQTQRRGRKTYLFGYGCGLAAAPFPGGEVVLATYTQPFNRQDITYFAPVYDQVTATLGTPPTNLTADAAFDAWQVYAACASTGGIAAIAANRRGPTPPRSADGHPLCAKGFVMTPTTTGQHEDGYCIQRYRCPLRGTTASCDHPRFARGGCEKRINIEPGGLRRATIDRTAPAYRAIYLQRTSVERINSQAKALRLERPNVRTINAIKRLVTLTAITINLRLIGRRFPPEPTDNTT